MATSDYNYAVFPPDDDVDAFRDFGEHLKVEELAPDPELTDLASGQPTHLSTYTDQGLTIVEFGSIT